MAQSVEHVIGNDEVISSILITSSMQTLKPFAGMAQSVEHVIGNDEVISSILITSSKSTAKAVLFYHQTPKIKKYGKF